MTEDRESPGASRLGYLLYVLLSGAAVLGIEILGSRVLAPFFGATIVIWTTLITVTLVALAVGYVVGGWLIDRIPRPTVLHVPVMLAGVWVLAMEAARATLLPEFLSLGLRTGTIVASSVLFLPPLLLLGMVSPVAIRLNLSSLEHTGRTTGQFYATSTVGSVLGAVLTGFVLVDLMGTGAILTGIGVLLIGLGGVGLVLRRRAGIAGAAAALGLAATQLGGAPAELDGVVKHRVRSSYGNHQVMEIQGVRYLCTEGLMHSMVDAGTLENRSSYVGCLELVPCLRPEARRALQIGLGGGLVPTIFQKHYGISSDVVEIDPAVVGLATDYFGFEPSGAVHVADGRTYFHERDDETYDVIVLDVFTTDRQPAHLFSLEYFRKLSEHLSPDGLLAINTFGFDEGPNAVSWESVSRTLAEVFPERRAFYATRRPKTAEDKMVNIVLFASPASLKEVDLSRARMEKRPFLEQCLAQETDLEPHESRGLVLTDDFNPLDRMTASIFLAARRAALPAIGRYLSAD